MEDQFAEQPKINENVFIIQSQFQNKEIENFVLRNPQKEYSNLKIIKFMCMMVQN